MGWFENWFGTRYYASLYGHRDGSDAKAWVDMIVDRWGLGPGERLLDLACGRGRHVRWFAEAGMRCTGVDISEESISEAARVVPQADFMVRDMREPIGSEEFDVACCLFTSLGYFNSLNDNEQVFKVVFSSLRPGGRFVLDFMNSRVVLRGLVGHEEIDRDNVHYVIDRGMEDGVLVKRIRVTDHGQVHLFEERVQALDPGSLIRMAQDAGFIIEDHTEGPVPDPFDPEVSERSVLWMKKPNA